METIQLKTDLSKVIPIYSCQEYNIYEYGEYLVKIFNTDDKDILINKQNKLEILNSLNITDINALLEQNGLLKGFLRKKREYFSSLSSLEEAMCKTSRKQKLKDLRIISDRLNKLHENGIILGDLTLKSVFANKKDLEFLNLDNCCIGKYGFDYPNFNQKRYLDIIGEVDEKLDTYMLNLLTMTYLENLTDQGILYYIRKNRPSFTLDTRRNESILESMVYLDKESKNNIDLLIDNMRYVKKK